MSLLIKDTEAGQRDRMRDDLARISQATDKMQRLLDELLELSRVGRLMNAPEQVPLENIVREAVSTEAARARGAGRAPIAGSSSTGCGWWKSGRTSRQRRSLWASPRRVLDRRGQSDLARVLRARQRPGHRSAFSR
jgi:signal transduction histidine kinase